MKTVNHRTAADWVRRLGSAGEAADSPGMTVGDISTPMPPPMGAPFELPPPWQDLALNRPGQAVQDRAQAEYELLREEHGRLKAGLLRLTDQNTDERSWRIGAVGERRVGIELERLSKKGFRVLHSVPVGQRGSDIDHVLIGPPGVFTINTKWHPEGRIWVGRSCVKVNGRNQPYIRNSRFEAERASRLLQAQLGWTPPVSAILAFDTTDAAELTVKTQPEGVQVLSHRELRSWLRRQQVRLSPEQVAGVFAVARRSTTWAS